MKKHLRWLLLGAVAAAALLVVVRGIFLRSTERQRDESVALLRAQVANVLEPPDPRPPEAEPLPEPAQPAPPRETPDALRARSRYFSCPRERSSLYSMLSTSAS